MSSNTQTDSIQLYDRMIAVLRELAEVRFKGINQYGITTPQFIVMYKLQQNPKITQGELANELHVSKGNISQMMKIMGREELIQRHADGAAYRISLTEKAEAILEKIVPEQHRLVKEHMDRLSVEDVASLEIIVKKLEQILSK